MPNNKHLTLDNRTTIETMLDLQASFKEIAAALDKDPSTISKEIRSHLVFRHIGGIRIPYNSCALRSECQKSHVCAVCHSTRKYSLCRRCSMCNGLCKDFKKEICSRLLKPPYVCNGCKKRSSCSLEKRFYFAQDAYNEYRDILSEARCGISLSEKEISHLDEIISPLIRKKQSLHHICVHHTDSIMVSESTLYRFVDYNLFSARNIDMPRKVRYAKRRKKKDFKVDKACRIGRSYQDFLAFCKEHPELPVTQIESVEGIRGGKVLLTIHFVKAECMLAYLRDSNDSQSVIDIFEKLYLELRPDIFTTLMPILLGDNGSEFSNPRALELDRQGNLRTHVFYCDASAPYQKGSAERNHEFIRMFLPKGTSLDSYTQEDISLMMDHINSYSRPGLGNKCPYEMMKFLYGENVVRLLGMKRIPPDEVTLNKSVFQKKEDCNV